MKTAVMICNMGGPNSLDEVEPYLLNIFSDADIIDIPMPHVLRKRFVRWLVKKRGPKSREIYQKIGGKTPLNEITRQQADRLSGTLNNTAQDFFDVYPAMRYWHPMIEDVWQHIQTQHYERIVAVSLYPFYATATTGSMEKLIRKLSNDNNPQNIKTSFISRFGNHPDFIQAMAGQIKCELAPLRQGKSPDILFSAHSIPLKRIKQGDPYQKEIEQAIRALKKQLPADINVHLSYQSKVGPVPWLGPATADKIMELAADNITHLLVYPLGFVADNSETIYEINMLYRDLALSKGITRYQTIPALNTDQRFIDALYKIVMSHLQDRGST